VKHPLAITATDAFQNSLAPRISRRAYQAGQSSRLTADWPATPISIDQDLRIWNRIVRERARDLSKNNDYAKHFIRLNQINVVGPDGFTLQMDAGERNAKGEWVRDDDANNRIEDAWAEWSRKKYCTVNGRLSLRGLEHLLIASCARDGEGMIRLVRDRSSKFGLTLQGIAAEALDELHNRELPSGNIIKMGVELDIWKRPVRYWLRRYKPELELYGGLQYSYDYLSFNADEIIHGFDMEYENQTRGVSWMVQSMFRLKQLTSYEEAALVNARTAAAKMGFLESATGEGGEYQGQGETPDGDIISQVEPGVLEQLPVGMTFAPWDPKYPDAQHDMFVNSILRGVASGCGISFNTFANNLREVNYSSIRAGLLVERDAWMMKQAWMRETFLEPVFEAWLEMAILTGAVRLKDGMQNFQKYNRPKFIGRRWPWVDPIKDIEAQILALQAGLDDPYTAAARDGKDLEEVYKRLADAKKLATSLGLTLKLDEIKAARPSSAVAQAVEDATGEDTSNRSDEELADILRKIFADGPRSNRRNNNHHTPALAQ
jgi:lambda family phage portal protein